MFNQEELVAKLKPTHSLTVDDTIEECPLSIREKLMPNLASESRRTSFLTAERVDKILPQLTSLISFFRWYPDIFLDQILDPNAHFVLAPFQRIFLRACFRHRYVYATFPRGYSKSMLAILAKYLQCILYPNSKVFMVSPGKQQSMDIVQEKVEEIWKIWPALRGECRFGKAIEDTKMQRDNLRIRFKNNSYFDVLAYTEHTRGQRRTSGIIEEAAQIEGTLLSSVIIPTMNISRRAANGKEDPNDITNKSQIYITTAGFKNTFPYDKLCTILIWSAIRPEESFCFGGTWRTPVAYGLLSQSFKNDLRRDATYADDTFNREYESNWSGSGTEAFFSEEAFNACRTIKEPVWGEDYSITPSAQKGFIVLGYDVGRNSDNSTCVVIQALLTANNTYDKRVLNIFAFEKMHFAEQAKMIKKIYIQFNAQKLVIDANGPGIGLVDFLTIPTPCENGDPYPAFGVDKDSDKKEMYKNYYSVANGKYSSRIWLMRATESLNSEMHNYVAAQITNQKVRFLIGDQLAKAHWERKDIWKTLTPEERGRRMQPYIMTRLLEEEMMNLRKKDNDSTNTTLKKISSRRKKDKFSALEYALYYIRTLENRRNLKGDDKSFHLVSSRVGRRSSSVGVGGIRDSRGGARGNGKFRRG